MRVFLAMVGKDLRLLLRDKTGFFFALIFPLLMAVFFGSVFSSGSSETNALAIALVDEDESEKSAAFAELLAAAEDLEVELMSRESATTKVSGGNLIAYVLLPKGFGAARERMFWGTPPTVHIGVDPSRRAEAAMLEGIITRHLVSGFQKLFSDRSASKEMLAKAKENLGAGGFPEAEELRSFLTGLDRFLEIMPQAGGAAWSPAAVKVEDVLREGIAPPNAFAISFPQGIVWGLMMCAMTFALGLVTERTEGTLMRLRVAPISRTQILAGKAGACFALVLAVQVGLIAIGAVIFDVSVGSFPVLALAILASSVSFVGIMMLLSVLGRTEKAASGYATAMMLVLMMIGGGMIPLFFMPSWMQAISHASPVKWAVLAIEGGTWRGFTIGDIAVPVMVLVGVGVACFAIGTKLFRDS